MKLFVVYSTYWIIFAETQALVMNRVRYNILHNEPILNDNLEKAQIKPPSSKATIIKQEFTRFKDGGYRFYYETSEGQSREEVGFFRDDPKLGRILNIHGSYGYIGPTNKKVFVKYVSDERGFRYENSIFPPVGLPSNIINQQLGIFNI